MARTSGTTTDVTDPKEYYVYRLIDPRNGQTFYVGKGKGYRVESHLSNVDSLLKNKKVDELELRKATILSIQRTGQQPVAVIHRHGMDEVTAFEVEAALIDAFPGLTNQRGGHGSGERGARSLQEFRELSSIEVIEPDVPSIAFSISVSSDERSIYNATRGLWRLSVQKARKAQMIFGVDRGVIRGVFVAKRWLPAVPEHFPWLETAVDDRYGFEGGPAESSVERKFLGKRLPSPPKGAMNPVRYFHIS